MTNPNMMVIPEALTPADMAYLLVETGIIPPCDEEEAADKIASYYDGTDSSDYDGTKQ